MSLGEPANNRRSDTVAPAGMQPYTVGVWNPGIHAMSELDDRYERGQETRRMFCSGLYSHKALSIRVSPPFTPNPPKDGV